MNIIIHDNTGKIIRSVFCPESMAEAQCHTGESYLEGRANDATQYVLNGQLTERPVMPVTVTGQTLTGAPEGATISINGKAAGVADGTDIELTFDLPGDYRVKAELFPYLDYEVTIHAD